MSIGSAGTVPEYIMRSRQERGQQAEVIRRVAKRLIELRVGVKRGARLVRKERCEIQGRCQPLGNLQGFELSRRR